MFLPIFSSLRSEEAARASLGEREEGAAARRSGLISGLGRCAGRFFIFKKRGAGRGVRSFIVRGVGGEMQFLAGAQVGGG